MKDMKGDKMKGIKMKITEKEIRSYLKNKNAELVSIDMAKGKFQYQPIGAGYNITGFVTNVQEWLETLLLIGKEKYHLAKWWKEQNNIEWNLLQEGEKLQIKRETEKAFLITNNANTEVWFPKSVLKII